MADGQLRSDVPAPSLAYAVGNGGQYLIIELDDTAAVLLHAVGLLPYVAVEEELEGDGRARQTVASEDLADFACSSRRSCCVANETALKDRPESHRNLGTE